jgi:nickel/cobalt exporter
MRRLLAVLAGAFGLAVLPTAAASAHPLGNFTVNLYSGLRVAPDAVHVDLVLDMAEIPAYQERQAAVDADHDGSVSGGERSAYGSSACARLAGSATLTVGTASVPLVVESSEVAFPAGQAGLATMRVTCALRGAAAIDGPTPVAYRIGAYTDRVGWREITAVGDRTTLAATSVPAASRSARLTAYPADLLTSPLDVRSADLSVQPGGPAASASLSSASGEPALRGVDRATRAFTGLVSRQDLTVPFGLLAVLLALGLGALHAFAPGHGKTVMAAFLLGRHDGVSRRAGWRQAARIGLTVTVTHTAGVMILGLALVASVSVAPDRLYPWLGLVSGLLLAAVGLTLVRRPAHHDHGPGGHTHPPVREPALVLAGSGPAPVSAPASAPAEHGHGHSHSHGHDHHHAAAPGTGRGRLLVMGLVGGLVPSPSALVVLLGAVALGRTWFGVLLVVAYGAGMAACLVGLGALLAHGGALLRRADGNPLARRLTRALPVVTTAVIVVVGVGLATQAAAALLS